MANRLTKLYKNGPVAMIAGIFALLAMLWGLWTNHAFNHGPAAYDLPHLFNRPIDSPILAMELARNLDDVDSVTQKRNSQAILALRVNTAYDCVFIPLYTGYLAFYGVAYKPRRKSAFVVLICLIGIFDYIENACMFANLHQAYTGHFFPYAASVTKWALLSIGVIVVGFLLLSKNDGLYSKPTRGLLALLLVASGTLILAGLTVAPYSWLALGAKLFAYTFIVNAIGLLGSLAVIKAMKQEFQPDFCAKRKIEPNTPAITETPVSAGQ